MRTIKLVWTRAAGKGEPSALQDALDHREPAALDHNPANQGDYLSRHALTGGWGHTDAARAMRETFKPTPGVDYSLLMEPL